MTNLEININIQAPELAAAITKLAEALPGKAVTAAANRLATAPAPEPELSPAARAMQQLPTTAPAPILPTAPVMTAQRPASVAMPAAYTLEQLMAAAGERVQAGKQPELLTLLGKYGVQSMTQLAPGQYDAFATDLRSMGAKI